MVTVTQIAKAAGVSRVCASQVLNNTPNTRVSRPVRERILRTARQMNYVPRAPRGASRSRSIAYVLSTRARSDVEQGLLLSSKYHFRSLNCLQQEAAAHERTVLFLAIRDDRESLAQVVRLLELERPLGVVLDGTVTSPQVRALRRTNLPLVVAGVTPYAFSDAHTDIATVSPDPTQAIGLLLGWMRQRGGQRVALATGPTWMLINSMAIEAFRQQVRQFGLDDDASLIQVSELEHGVAVYERYVQLGITYDGIVFGNWNMAIAAMPLIEQHQPGCLVATIGDCGFSSPEADHMAVAGTAMQEYARTIYNAIDDQIHDRRRRRQHVIVPYDLRLPLVEPGEFQA